MKKMIMTLVLVLALGLGGCAAPEANDTPENFAFSYNGTQIAMKTDAEPIIAALGEPIRYMEEPSCAFEGMDKTFYYGSFYLSTYPDGGKDYVQSVWFADDSVSTQEGIHIGMSQADAEAICGAENFNGDNAYILTKGQTQQTILLEDGAVSSVQYQAVFD